MIVAILVAEQKEDQKGQGRALEKSKGSLTPGGLLTFVLQLYLPETY